MHVSHQRDFPVSQKYTSRSKQKEEKDECMRTPNVGIYLEMVSALRGIISRLWGGGGERGPCLGGMKFQS